MSTRERRIWVLQLVVLYSLRSSLLCPFFFFSFSPYYSLHAPFFPVLFQLCPSLSLLVPSAVIDSVSVLFALSLKIKRSSVWCGESGEGWPFYSSGRRVVRKPSGKGQEQRVNMNGRGTSSWTRRGHHWLARFPWAYNCLRHWHREVMCRVGCWGGRWNFPPKRAVVDEAHSKARPHNLQIWRPVGQILSGLHKLWWFRGGKAALLEHLFDKTRYTGSYCAQSNLLELL